MCVTPGDLPEYLALTLQARFCKVGQNLSLVSRGMIMEPFENKKINSKVGEAGAEVDAELGLQRSSTNQPLQTASEESQVPTVAAGPGSSGSGTNVVPRKIVMVEDTNQQALDKESARNWRRFETSFSRGGVFIFVVPNPGTKAWLIKTVSELRPWEGANLKVSGVEILQKRLKATAWTGGLKHLLIVLRFCRKA